MGSSEHGDKSFEFHQVGELLDKMSYHQLSTLTLLYKAIAPLSNGICPEVKLGDFNVFFCADYRSEIYFVISPTHSKEHTHLE